MKPRQSFGAKQPTIAEGRANLARLLTNARSLDTLPGLSQLAHIYRLSLKEVEYAVTIERQRRAQ